MRDEIQPMRGEIDEPPKSTVCQFSIFSTVNHAIMPWDPRGHDRLSQVSVKINLEKKKIHKKSFWS